MKPERAVTPSNIPQHARVITGAILRHGNIEDFPTHLKQIVSYDEARDYYQISRDSTAVRLHTEPYSHYAEGVPGQTYKNMNQFWIRRGWYRYHPDTNRIALKRADWNDEETRLEAIRTMVTVTGKDVHDIDSTDFEEHRLISMIGKYYHASPTQALAAAGFKIDLTRVKKKPNKYKNDIARVRTGFRKWTKDEGYRFKYENKEGEMEEIIEFPNNLEDLPGGVSWVEAIKPHGGMTAVSEIAGCPVLTRKTGRANGSTFYLRHPTAFRHHALERIKERGWFNEQEKTVNLPRPITLMRDDKPMQELVNAIYYMHRHPGENAHETLSRLLGLPVTAKKLSAGGPGRKKK